MTEHVRTKQNQFLEWLVPLALVCLTIIAYLPSLHYPFQFDDEPNILKFFDIRNKSFGELFFSSTRWVSTWISTLCYRLGGFDPLVYRTFNLSLHCLNGALVYALVLLCARMRQCTHARLIATLSAGLFLLHPVQTQTVSYVIQGQLEGLATLGILLLALSLIGLVISQRRGLKIINVMNLCVIAFVLPGTKEIAIVAPILLILIDWFFIARGSGQQLAKRWWIHGLVALIVWGGYWTLLGKNFLWHVVSGGIEHKNTAGNVLTSSFGTRITPWLFFISQFKVILHYLAMFVWPAGLCVDYDWKLCTSLWQPDCLLPACALLALAIFVLWLLMRDKINSWAAGMLWFALVMAPRATIMPSTELAADYKTYSASIGWLVCLSLILVWLWIRLKQHLQPKHTRTVGIVILIILGGSLMSATLVRNRVWSSGAAFWADVIQKAPSKARGYNNYASALLRINQPQQALVYARKAIDLEPRTYADAYNNTGVALTQLRHYEQALKYLDYSRRIRPRHARTYFNIAIAHEHMGNLDQAIDTLKQAVALAPHYGKAYIALTREYFLVGDVQQAWECAQYACLHTDVDRLAHAWRWYAYLSKRLGKFNIEAHARRMMHTL